MFVVKCIDRLFGFTMISKHAFFDDAMADAEKSAIILGHDWLVLVYDENNPLDCIEF